MISAVVFLVFAGISFFCHLIALVLLIKRPKLRKNFKDVTLVLCTLGMVYDIHWLTLSDTIQNAINGICYEYAAFNAAVYFLIWNYSSVLSLQLYGKVVNQSEAYFKHRNLVYHLSCCIISVFEAIAIVILGNFGKTSIQTCFITESSPGEIIYLIPLILNLPIGILSCFKYFMHDPRIPKHLPTCLILLSILITWGISTFFILINYFLRFPQSRLYSESSVSISGLFFLISLIFNKYSLRKLRNNASEAHERVIYFKSSNSSLLSLGPINSSNIHRTNSIDMLANYLEDQEKLNFLKILSLLLVRFSISDQSAGSISETPIKKHQYEQSILSELEEKLNIKYFTNRIRYSVEVHNLTLKEHFYNDLNAIRYKNNYFDADVFESLIHYQNFYNLEELKGDVLNKEFLTSDNKFSLMLIRTSAFRNIKNAVKKFIRVDDAKGMFDKILAVFEVEKLDRVLIVKEGCDWSALCKEVIKVNANEEPIVRVFEIVDKKLVDKGEKNPIVYVENSHVLNNIEDGVEILDKCGAAGYSIIVYPTCKIRFYFSSEISETKPMQIIFKITDIFVPDNYKSSIFNVLFKNQERSDYKANILKNLKCILK